MSTGFWRSPRRVRSSRSKAMTDTISLPEAVKQSILAARPAYALFGATDQLGVNYANHGHAFTADDWTAMMDFFDKYSSRQTGRAHLHRFPTEKELDDALAKGK